MGANTYTYYPSADGSGTAGRWEQYAGATMTTVTIRDGLSTTGTATWISTADGLYRERLDGSVACGECPT